MAAFLDTMQVNSAITDNTKLDLAHMHITTSNPFRLSPLWIREMVPGEKVKVDMESFCRMNPLAVPTFGRMNVKVSAYMVPARTVFPGAADFWVNSPHTGSDYSDKLAPVLIESVPFVRNNTLLQAFLGSAGSEFDDYDHLVFPGDSSVYDLRILDSSNAYSYYRLTVLGVAAMTNLESLGYKINPNKLDETPFNGLPILCLSRIYADWYWPQNFTETRDYYNLLGPCKYDMNSGLAPYELTAVDVRHILITTAYSNYESDWTTVAYEVPNQPIPGAHSDFKIVNIDSIGQVYGQSLYNVASQNGVTNNSGVALNNGDAVDRYGKLDAPFITGYVNSSGNGSAVTGGISEYLLHALHSMTDWMKRNQISSSAFTRFLARYGKALSAEKMNRSVYLGTNTFPLQIGDVMATSDTFNSETGTGAVLGDYSGKGLGYSRSQFEASTDEPAYFVVLCSVIPATGCGWQGVSPLVKRLTVNDHYQPEYDSLGVEVVTKDEVYMTQGATNSGTSLVDPAIHDEAFGYLPRYWGYKTVSDAVTGNFRVPTLNGSAGSETPVEFNAANSWYLLRAFSDATWESDRDNIVHSLSYMLGRHDAGQYNRIFYNASHYAPDQLTFIHNFGDGTVSYFPGKSLFDTYEFEDEGKKVTVDVGGPKKN